MTPDQNELRASVQAECWEAVAKAMDLGVLGSANDFRAKAAALRAQAKAAPAHARVFEYDGAFKCLDCDGRWGVLPGNPEMPEECKDAQKPGMVKDTKSMVETHQGPAPQEKK